jgi:hypothetical protein
MNRKKTFVLSCVFVVLFTFVFASADVTYKQKVVTSGIPMMGDMESESVVKIKGDKKSEDSKTKFTGGVMKMMGKKGEQQSLGITRLDKELIWNINLSEKKYTETTFEELKKNDAGNAREGPREKAGS